MVSPPLRAAALSRRQKQEYETMQKEKIIKCFNSGVSTYDSAADVQKIAVTQLSQKMLNIPAKKILEIGCGTGFLSDHLISRYPNADILLTDIAPAMVSSCQQRFADYPKVKVSCMDGEAITATIDYDLIASSMTLHWFDDIQQGIKQMIARLTTQGQLIFAMLGENSLLEWRQFCEMQKIPISTPRFPSVQALKKHFPTMQINSENWQQPYQHTHHFLSTLKLLGAHASAMHHAPFSAGMLRKLMRDFDAKQRSSYYISYEIIYGSYIKS
jgi:malonyl-CoA O-methyltransferase